MQHKFLFNNLQFSEQLSAKLIDVGVAHNDIHFLTETSEDYLGHNVQEASIFEERDILHSSLRSAVLGAAVGALVGAYVYFAKPLGWQIQPINVFFLMALFVGFGTWLGGLFGISHRNYRLTDCEKDLQQGKAIMLVYTDDEHAKQARKIVANTDRNSRYLGQSPDYDNPLVNADLEELDH